MNEQLNTQISQNLTLCNWCGILLGSANTVEKSVCIRCYDLLINASVSDEEIFGNKELKKENSLSHLDTKEVNEDTE